MNPKPVVLGGTPIFKNELPFVRPCLPPLEELRQPYGEIFRNGMVTTGQYAEDLGGVIADYLGVKHAVAISSCTTGLVLAVQALSLPKGSEVILPSFTFMASALAPIWNQLRLRFVDVDRTTMNFDLQAVENSITAETSAILAVHQFGNPAPVEALEQIASKHGLALIFDAAHGFGALHSKKPLGRYGQAEVFSLSPTKLMIAAEGGIVATGDEGVAEHVRIGRNYGNPGNYDCLFPGFNARMSELHAILALRSFDMLEGAVQHRNRVVQYCRERLNSIPGIHFQHISSNDRSSFKDFSLVVDENVFGLTQKQLAHALLAENIHTRIYYSPVLHQMEAFKSFAPADAHERLAETLYLESHALSLPLYSDMSNEEAEALCAAIERIHAHAGLIAAL